MTFYIEKASENLLYIQRKYEAESINSLYRDHESVHRPSANNADFVRIRYLSRLGAAVSTVFKTHFKSK